MAIKLEVINEKLFITNNGIGFGGSYSFDVNGDYVSIYTAINELSSIRGIYSDFVDELDNPYANVDDVRDKLLLYKS